MKRLDKKKIVSVIAHLMMALSVYGQQTTLSEEVQNYVDLIYQLQGKKIVGPPYLTQDDKVALVSPAVHPRSYGIPDGRNSEVGHRHYKSKQ
ncbi:MAG: hypothetical protein II886_05545 [Prevotella sp.]|nr:hypothetical protein [Prevotella sp.]